MAANNDDGQLPKAWTDVVLWGDDAKSFFLLRPRQFLAAPEDAADVQESLPPGWVRDDGVKSRSAVRFTLTGGAGTAAEVVAALEEVRKATADRPRGPAKVAPNHVLVGEQAVTFTGEPRIQGGNATAARPERPPHTLPQRTLQAADGTGVTVAVLDTGLFKNALLPAGQIGGTGHFADTWDLDHDGFGDAEAGHGTFVSGLVLQVAPAAHVLDVKVLDSHGVGDDLVVAKAIEQLPKGVQIVNLSLGGYTEDDAAPLAVARALHAVRDHGGVIVAAAGNSGQPRPFWPAAFKHVLAVGAADLDKRWARPEWSNYGYWVDAVTRGSNVASTYATAKTRYVDKPGDQVTGLAFQGWARWDGTSFATPVVCGCIARLMTRNGLADAQSAVARLLSANPPGPQPDFPLAVLVDDLEPGVPLP